MYVICVFICTLSAECKIAPWVQSKSMQSKQEMATIERVWGGGKETDGDSPLQEGRRSVRRVPGSENSTWYQLCLLQKAKEWLRVVFLCTGLFVHLQVCLYERDLHQQQQPGPVSAQCR